MSVKKNESRILIIGIFVIAFLGSLIALGIASNYKIFHNTGSIIRSNMSVCWDSECTRSINSINWGVNYPDNTVKKNIYIKNISTKDVSLKLYEANWQPNEANRYIWVWWNREDYVLKVNQTTSATISMKISSVVKNISNYSFEIVIEAIE